MPNEHCVWWNSKNLLMVPCIKSMKLQKIKMSGGISVVHYESIPNFIFFLASFED